MPWESCSFVIRTASCSKTVVKTVSFNFNSDLLSSASHLSYNRQWNSTYSQEFICITGYNSHFCTNENDTAQDCSAKMEAEMKSQHIMLRNILSTKSTRAFPFMLMYICICNAKKFILK